MHRCFFEAGWVGFEGEQLADLRKAKAAAEQAKIEKRKGPSEAVKVGISEFGQTVAIEVMTVRGSSTEKTNVNLKALRTDHSWACLSRDSVVAGV